MDELEVYKSACKYPVWILSETKFRVRYLTHALTSNHSFFGTLGDGFWRLLRIMLPGEQPKRLTQAEEELILIRLITESTALPNLAAEIIQDGPLRALRRSVAPIRRFLQIIRLHERNEILLRQILDEFGNTRVGKERLEELFLLLEAYRSFQVEEKCFDAVGVLETAAELLSRGEAAVKKFNSQLPREILLDQLTELFPLERRLLGELNQFLPVRLVLGEQELNAEVIADRSLKNFAAALPPSKKSLASVLYFAREAGDSTIPVAAIHSDREPLISALFDGAPPAKDLSGTGIAVWECTEGSDEVKRLSRAIALSISQGKIKPAAVHIVALNIDRYSQLLERELLSHGLEVWIPKGRRLSETTVGSYLDAFIQWVTAPGLETLRGLVLNPLYAMPPDLNFNDFFALCTFLGLLPQCLAQANWEQPLLEYFKKREREAQGLVAVSAAIEFVKAQLLIAAELRRLIQNGEPVSLIRKAFHRSRRRINRLLPKSHRRENPLHRRELQLAAAALRDLRGAFEQATAFSALYPEERMTLFAQNISDVLKSRYVSLPEPDDAVAITELLDVRAMKSRVTAIVGFTADSFPPFEADGSGELEKISASLDRAAGKAKGVYEAYALFAHVLRNSEELILSFPRQSAMAEVEPAPLLEMLVGQLAESRLALIAEPADDWRKNEVGKAADKFFARAQNYLQSRLSTELTSFDGKVTDLTSDELSKSLLGQHVDRSINLSVSELELFADCPHRFFFSRMLGLKTRYGSFADLLAQETGNIVHGSLKDFFLLKDAGRTVSEDFDAACKLMLTIAEKNIAASILSELSHPFARAQCERIKLGLDQPGDSGKRGILKGALAFHRDLMPAEHISVEHPFGKNAALVVDTGIASITVSGAIDRIDFTLDEQGQRVVHSVWDYKTGPVKKHKQVQEGSSLQLPLYALAVKQNIPPYAFPKRGGMVGLSKPNLREDDYSTTPVIMEHLAYRKGARGLVSEEVALTVERSTEHVKNLATKLLTGTLHQRLETEGCPYCEFQLICGRDEALLDRKLAEMKPENLQSTLIRPDTVQIRSRKKSLGRLSPEQEEGAKIERNIALSAGAGSGKTAVICARVLRLMLSGAPISSIVAVTFTEKAAEDIRARIERIIDESLNDNSFQGRELTEQERGLLIAARAELVSAPIGTIHSFAADILQADPVLAGLGAYESVVQGGEQLELIKQAVEETFSGTARSQVAQIIAQGIAFSALTQQVSRLVQNSRQRALLKRGTEARLQHELFEALRQAYTKRCQNSIDSLKARLEEWLAGAKSWLTEVQNHVTVEPKRLADYQALLEQTERLLQTVISGRPEDWVGIYKELFRFSVEHQRSAMIRGKHNPRNFWTELRDQILKKNQGEVDLLCAGMEREERGSALAGEVIGIAEKAAERYRALKMQLGKVDFDDLIFTAHSMLCDTPARGKQDRQSRLKERLSARYRHLLVDEFQDTDPLQWELVRAIGAEIFEKQGGGRTVFIVGDPQQAIYGFRGGDVRVFSRAQSEISAIDGEILSLRDNYRAHPEIIRFVNAFFSELFAVDFDEAGEARIGTAVTAKKMHPMREAESNETPRVTALFSIRGQELEEGSELSALTEADRVADFLRQVLSDNKQWAALSKAESGPQIAVLTRKAKHLQLIAQALEARRLPFSISHSAGFFELPEILQFENLFTWLSEPHDAVALIGVLRSPLFGLNDTELLRLYLELGSSWEKLGVDSNLVSAGPETGEINERLLRWRAFGAAFKPSVIIEAVLDDTRLSAVYESVGQTESFRNIERLIEVLRAAEKEHAQGGSLKWARDWFRRQHQESYNAPTANSSAHPIILTTIHASKGLEFPMVVLPYLNWKRRNEFDFVSGEVELPNGEPLPVLGIRVEESSGSYQRKKTFAQKLIEESEAALACAEERRLFYVACTRAKDYLVLSFEGEKKFSENQAKIQELSQAERREKCFKSDVPWHWVRHLLEVDSVDAPGSWILKADDGEVSLPIVRPS